MVDESHSELTDHLRVSFKSWQLTTGITVHMLGKYHINNMDFNGTFTTDELLEPDQFKMAATAR